MTVVHIVNVMLAVRVETLTTPTTAFDHCRLWLTVVRIFSTVSVN